MFLGLENKSVRRNGWNPFVKFLEDNKLDQYFKLVGNEMIAYYKGMRGIEVHFQGADHVKVAEGLRGPNYHYIGIDEAGSFRNEIIENIIDESAGPGLGSVGGEIELQGTPPPIPNTFFERAFKGQEKGWKNYYWTHENNPYVADTMEEYIENLLIRKNWTRDVPKFRREYMGEFVYDSSRMLLKFGEENTCSTVDLTGLAKPTYYLGVDFGYRDSSAAVVLMELGREVYAVDYFKKSGITPTEFSRELKALIAKYNIEYHNTAADYGGLGRAILEDYKREHGLFLKDAEKSKKGISIEKLQEMLSNRSFKVYDSCYEISKELAELERNPKKPDQPKEGQEDHLFDCVLYSLKRTRTYQHEDEIIITEEDAMMNRAIQQSQDRKKKEDSWLGIDDDGDYFNDYNEDIFQ